MINTMFTHVMLWVYSKILLYEVFICNYQGRRRQAMGNLQCNYIIQEIESQQLCTQIASHATKFFLFFSRKWQSFLIWLKLSILIDLIVYISHLSLLFLCAWFHKENSIGTYLINLFCSCIFFFFSFFSFTIQIY